MTTGFSGRLWMVHEFDILLRCFNQTYQRLTLRQNGSQMEESS